jgi:hypothetical protein
MLLRRTNGFMQELQLVEFEQVWQVALQGWQMFW